MGYYVFREVEFNHVVGVVLAAGVQHRVFVGRGNRKPRFVAHDNRHRGGRGDVYSNQEPTGKAAGGHGNKGAGEGRPGVLAAHADDGEIIQNISPARNCQYLF